jgi:hypothetical protein
MNAGGLRPPHPLVRPLRGRTTKEGPHKRARPLFGNTRALEAARANERDWPPRGRKHRLRRGGMEKKRAPANLIHREPPNKTERAQLAYKKRSAPAHSRALPFIPVHSRALPSIPVHSRSFPFIPAHSRSLPSTPVHSRSFPFPPKFTAITVRAHRPRATLQRLSRSSRRLCDRGPSLPCARSGGAHDPHSAHARRSGDGQSDFATSGRASNRAGNSPAPFRRRPKRCSSNTPSSRPSDAHP